MAKRNKENHIKYQYLIWKSDEGFMYLDQFSDNELSVFLKDMKKAATEPEAGLRKIKDNKDDQ